MTGLTTLPVHSVVAMKASSALMAVVLSQSATTRLVTRLEDRGLLARYLCPTDRRGICTDVTEACLELLVRPAPTNDAALHDPLEEAAMNPELAPLVRVVKSLKVPA